MERFTERFSNVLAWFGFSYFFLVLFFDLVDWRGFNEILIGIRRIDDEHFALVALVYVGCAVVNYLLVGRLRLLPWLKKSFTFL
tara:strand:- start:983 stop:1234 length:252 start_codon:yes stop_codon:yes gene_type:complete